MAIGTSLGAYFDDEFHHQAGINTDPSQDRIDVDPEVDPQSTKPKPELDILPVDKKMPFPDNNNPDTDFKNRFGDLPPSGIFNDLKKPDPDRPLLRRISDTQNGEPRLYVSPNRSEDIEDRRDEPNPLAPKLENVPASLKDIFNNVTGKYAYKNNISDEDKANADVNTPISDALGKRDIHAVPEGMFEGILRDAKMYGNLAISDLAKSGKLTKEVFNAVVEAVTKPAPDYDYEGWRKETGLDSLPEGQHYPDTYKLPNHITFSNESKYSTDKTPGGQWQEQPNKSWTFTPSAFNLTQHSPEELKTYFDQYEKGDKLILPGENLPDINTVPHNDSIENIGKSLYEAITLPGDVYKGGVDLSSDKGIERTLGLAGLGTVRVPETGPAPFVPHYPAVSEGPSPFEQVASAARRARPEDETDRALRAIHEALYPEGRTVADREATASQLFRQEEHYIRQPSVSVTGRAESFDELMARLDRQDQATIDAVPTNQFKDYGKVSVADRGYGRFLFKAGDSKVLPLNVSERENGKLLYVNWIGDQTYKSVNQLGGGVTRGLIKALAEKYPNAEEIAGFRISGARSGRADTARMRIPGRGKSNPPRKSIEDLSHEWDDEINPELQ